MAARRSSRSAGAFLLLWVACSSLVPPGALGYELTAANVKTAADAIERRILSEETDAPASPGKYKSFVAAFIRLAFKCGVGERGCAGCLNVNDPGNSGLDVSVDALEQVRAELGAGASGFNVSRGDLWALAAKVAFKVGANLASASAEEADAVRFRYGRTDCATAPHTDAMVPGPDRKWGADAALKYFYDRNFTQREVVALMGFHTVGVIKDGPGKVVGQWVSTPDHLNNQFYRDLVSKDWTQRATIFTGTGKTQTVYTWGAAGSNAKILMINTDVAILKNFTLANTTTGQSECAVMSACSTSSATTSDAQQFAGNVTMWRLEAAHALTKLIERGYSDESLKEPTPGGAAPAAAAPGSALAVVALAAFARLLSAP